MKFDELNISKDQAIENIIENVNCDLKNRQWYIPNYEFLGSYNLMESLKEKFRQYLKESDEFKNIKLDTTSDEGIICPICGHIHENVYDIMENLNSVDMECYNCGNNIFVEVEYNPIFNAFSKY